MANKYDAVSTKLVTFKTLRDGALLLDKDDRVLFIKAMDIDMGDESYSNKMIMRLADNGYEKQFRFVKIADPRWLGITWVENRVADLQKFWKSIIGKFK